MRAVLAGLLLWFFIGGCVAGGVANIRLDGCPDARLSMNDGLLFAVSWPATFGILLTSDIEEDWKQSECSR